ncbi:MAG: LPS assembly lipoprotein LptE [Pseudomonadota bacterium]
MTALVQELRECVGPWLRSGLLLLALSGCGFTLRDAGTPLMLDNLTLVSERPDGIVRALRQRLDALGVEVHSGGDVAGQRRALILENETREARRTTTSAGTSGAQYELTLSVDATLSAGDSIIAGPRTLQLRRQQNEDISNLTSSDSEREMLFRDMERELAEQMVEQLRGLPPQSPAPESHR